jgi:hypothetical protein
LGEPLPKKNVNPAPTKGKQGEERRSENKTNVPRGETQTLPESKNKDPTPTGPTDTPSPNTEPRNNT